MAEQRRSRRKKAPQTIQVTNSISGEVIGFVGNLSIDGMLLIANTPLVDDALYQLRFSLRDAPHHTSPIEVGAHLLWQDRTSMPGQTWTGFRCITMLESEMLQLRQWLDSPGGTYE